MLTPREDLVRVRLELLGRRREGLLFATLLRLDLVAGGGVPREVSRPVDDTEQLAGRHVEVCLVPIVLHLHVELPDHAGRASRGLGVHQSSRHVGEDAGLGETWTGDDFGRGLGGGGLGLERVVRRRSEIAVVEVLDEVVVHGHTREEREQRVDGREHLVRAGGDGVTLAHRLVVVLGVLEGLADLANLRLVRDLSLTAESAEHHLRRGLDEAPGTLVALERSELGLVRGDGSLELLAHMRSLVGRGVEVERRRSGTGVERVAPRQHPTVPVNVDVDVAVRDLETVDELTGVDVRDQCAGVGVGLWRVLV